MKYIGIDVGTKKVGLAYSVGIIAFPLETIKRENCVQRIIEEVIKRKIDVVIIGESINLDGLSNPVMKDVEEIKQELEENSIKVLLQPEQFSTIQASRLGSGTDEQSAAIILQSYIDKDVTEEIDFGE